MFEERVLQYSSHSLIMPYLIEMKLFHIVLSTCLSIFLYFILQSVWGGAGISACVELQTYKQRLETNIQQLQDIGSNMENDMQRLHDDPSRLRQEAYRIGMVTPEETRIRLPISIEIQHFSPGTIAIKPENSTYSQALITGVSICLGLVLLCLMTFMQMEVDLFKGSRRKHKRYYQGPRVQTASLE